MVEASWEGVDRGLFDALRELRSTLAGQQGVPAYVVFSDVTLRELARVRPSTLERLLAVKGVGQKKRDDYGQVFLERIAVHCAAHQLSQYVATEANSVVRPVVKQDKALSGSALAAAELFRGGASVEAVCTQMGRASSTVHGYLAEFIALERITDATPWVPAEMIEQVERVLPETGVERLKPIHDALEGQVDFNSIRIAAACWQNRQIALQSELPSTI